MRIEIDGQTYFEIVGHTGKTSEISSNLKIEDEDDQDAVGWNHQIDMLEALVLAHFVSGIDVTSDAYIQGIRTAVEAASNVTA